jgi:cytochrome c-type biogenesis protein CcmH
MLWVGLLLLTIGAMAAIVVPLLRGRQAPAPPRAAFDRAVYRDQLGEIARDLERGTLDADQAMAARLEIERRLLATDEPDEPAAARLPVRGITAIALAAAVAAGAMAVYLALGSPQLGDEPLAARRDDGTAPHAPADLAASVDALAARLKEVPDDARGWLLLARSQATLQRWQDSAASYQHAMTLTDSPEASAGLGEMLVMASDGLVTPAARSAFTTTLARDPGNTPARFYLALGDAQDGKASEAIAAWGKLVDEAPPGAPWLPLVRQHMAETARAAGIALPPQAARQAAPQPAPPSTGGAPSAADIEAVQAMSPAERQAMIRSMVERLAARLDANPDDAEGWQRLARAYAVLGETAKAEAAAARAAALAKPKP